ncbi:hypothetical protein [Saccharomonospora sp.]|uniref:hypothetical protein n=1 Tax=Saccharomonospora sp. TaxID=33913 RepID=UPI00261A8B1B|nr:hypothetical protein [Saccharomonospora sp.]
MQDDPEKVGLLCRSQLHELPMDLDGGSEVFGRIRGLVSQRQGLAEHEKGRESFRFSGRAQFQRSCSRDDRSVEVGASA